MAAGKRGRGGIMCGIMGTGYGGNGGMCCIMPMPYWPSMCGGIMFGGIIMGGGTLMASANERGA